MLRSMPNGEMLMAPENIATPPGFSTLLNSDKALQHHVRSDAGSHRAGAHLRSLATPIVACKGNFSV